MRLETSVLPKRTRVKASFRRLAAEAKASEATPKEAWSMGGTAPMLAITCLLDRVAVPENAYKIAETRPNTWLAGLPGCGHNMINEQPEELRRLIVGFIQARANK